MFVCGVLFVVVLKRVGGKGSVWDAPFKFHGK